MKSILSFALCTALVTGSYQSTYADSQTTHAKSPHKALNFLLGPLGIGIAALVNAYMQSNGGSFFGDSTWNVQKPGTITENFNSVAGNDPAKKALLDVVQFLKDSAAFDKIGANVPKGILLEGPPGTGKTLLARALAGEANCSFIAVSGSEFVEMWVGTGAARIRSLFKTARAQGPCIIFIDEIDALIQRRNANGLSGDQERNQTLNEFLHQVDGFDQYIHPVLHPHPLIIIGATNRADTADAAALRPGRFDRIIYVGLPTLQDREAILALHIQKIAYDNTVDLKVIAQRTAGFSGAALANVINEAAISAINNKKELVDQADLEAALDKILMGYPSNTQISAAEKKIIAYHEAGHALAHILLNKDASSLHKISIIPRGHTGGQTTFLDKECAHYTKQDFLNEIMVCFGGRAAEQLVCNTVMTGPAHDIHTATHIARTMICSYGMSDAIGPVAYHYYPDMALAPYAQSTLAAIDQEVKNILSECYNNTLTLLTTHKKKLDVLANYLLEKEELSATEALAIVKAIK
jgi:cell division protease FtsH